MIDVKQLNGLTLAYIGDTVFETYIREYAIGLGYQHVKDLHKIVVGFTSGEAQAKIVSELINNNMLTEEELIYFKRGRNSHVKSSRKNIGIQEYLQATGFEALIGFLYLSNNQARLNELMEFIIKKE